MSRPYRSNNHLHDVITSDAGSIEVRPQSADRITFDIASSNSLPANLPTSGNGSSVLDIGRGVQVRASGSIHREADGSWKLRERYTVPDLYGSVYPSGGELTRAMKERAAEVIERMIGEWASTHEGDIAQADDIERNNAARTLEEAIATHQEALKILRANLKRCEAGKDYSQYPDLPTKGR
jgi:hypothetical protein